MEQERILILIKPDGVSLGHIGEVITLMRLKLPKRRKHSCSNIMKN